MRTLGLLVALLLALILGSPAAASAADVWKTNFDVSSFNAQGWYTGLEHNFPDRYLYPTSPPTQSGVGIGTQWVPRRASGSDSYVSMYQVSQSDDDAGRIHSKAYWNQPWSNASGTYLAWIYVHSSLDTNVNGWGANSHLLSDLFQFKDNYGPGGSSDPLAWVSVAEDWGGAGADTTRPQMILNGINTLPWRQWVDLPLEQWFKVSATVNTSTGVGKFYLNDVLWATTAPGELQPKHVDSTNMVFGIGSYGHAKGSPVYIDTAKMTQP